MEYIIVDGSSTDRTVDIIKIYEEKIDYWVSENDCGIYDAMNKAIDLVAGDWINFMNAGDYFYDKNVLSTIFKDNEFKNIDIIYGNNEVRYPYKRRIITAGNIKNISKGSLFSHQSTLISSSLHKQNKYNIKNRISADFEFFYKSYVNGVKFKYLNKTFSSVSSGGLSDIKRIESIVGWWNVVEKNDNINFYYIFIILKEIIKEKVKKAIRIMKSIIKW